MADLGVADPPTELCAWCLLCAGGDNGEWRPQRVLIAGQMRAIKKAFGGASLVASCLGEEEGYSAAVLEARLHRGAALPRVLCRSLLPDALERFRRHQHAQLCFNTLLIQHTTA